MKIIVNGQELEISYRVAVSYANVVEYAGLSGSPSVTYNRGLSGAQGIMHVGEILPVVEGMIFNACHTGNA